MELRRIGFRCRRCRVTACVSTLFTQGFPGLFYSQHPTAQQVGVPRGIPDVWRVHNLSAPRRDQSDQSCIPAAARGGEGSTWSRRASSHSRDHPYSQQLHQRRLVSRQRKTRFSMRGTNIQGLITSCSTSHVRQTLLRHLDHKKSCVKAEIWSLLLPFLLI